MKNSILFLCFLFGASCFAQDITNTLPIGGKFIVRDVSNDYLTLSQSNGQLSLLRTLRLENTTNSNTGVIYKGADRFIHNYGTDNTFIGINSGNFITAGTFNAAFGKESLYSNTTGSYNTANGFRTLYYNTEGSYNTATGSYALSFNTTGNHNTAVGYSALNKNTSGSSNTASGSCALYTNTTGYSNTATGNYALSANTSGYSNTAFGYHSLFVNNSGNQNTAVGSEALLSNRVGNFNTSTGYQSLYTNDWGNYNTATGHKSLYSNYSGGYNTANGYYALFLNNSGDYNTAVGTYALSSISTQHNNTAVGYNAGNNYAFSAGTFLGYSAGPGASGYTNIMGLGANSRPIASNQVRIGSSSVTSIGGYAGWTNLSDERYKISVQENVRGLDFILKLRPITYKLDVNKLAADLGEDRRRDENGNIKIESLPEDIKARNEKSQIIYTGFIAQEVEKVAKEIGFEFSGIDVPKNENDFYGLRYAEFVVPLVKAVQEQQKIIQELKSEIKELKKK